MVFLFGHLLKKSNSNMLVNCLETWMKWLVVLANSPLQALPAKASQPLPGQEYTNQELCNDDVLCSENSSHQRVYLFFSSICFTLFSMKLLDLNFKQYFFLILTSMCILLWMFHMTLDMAYCCHCSFMHDTNPFAAMWSIVMWQKAHMSLDKCHVTESNDQKIQYSRK